MPDFRSLPKVDQVAGSEGLKRFPAKIRTQAARLAVASLREAVRKGSSVEVTVEAIAEMEAERIAAQSLGPAINLSGVILHTGLGRARLAPDAARALHGVAESHSTVELDVASGK